MCVCVRVCVCVCVWTHRATLPVTVDGEVRTEEQVSDGHQQRLSQRSALVITFFLLGDK